MRLPLISLVAVLWILCPTAGKADVIYVFSEDISGNGGFGAGSTINWEFISPSVLTTTTDITTFVSDSLGPGLSACGSITQVVLPQGAVDSGPYIDSLSTDWPGTCGSGFSGASGHFEEDITAPGTYTSYDRNTGAVTGSLTISETPEPAPVWLFGAGLLWLVGWRLLRALASLETS